MLISIQNYNWGKVGLGGIVDLKTRYYKLPVGCN